MRIHVEQRESGTTPVGFVLMLPLFALPLGAWAVQKGWIVFGTCGLKLLAGIPCLTCGATRATVHLLHGNIGSALAMQPLVVSAYGVLAVWGVVSFAAFAAGRRVQMTLTHGQELALKVGLLVTPFANWLYLVAAGV